MSVCMCVYDPIVYFFPTCKLIFLWIKEEEEEEKEEVNKLQEQEEVGNPIPAAQPAVFHPVCSEV